MMITCSQIQSAISPMRMASTTTVVHSTHWLSHPPRSYLRAARLVEEGVVQREAQHHAPERAHDEDRHLLELEEQNAHDDARHEADREDEPGHPLGSRLRADRAVDEREQDEADGEDGADEDGHLEEPEAHEHEQQPDHDAPDREVGVVLVHELHQHGQVRHAAARARRHLHFHVAVVRVGHRPRRGVGARRRAAVARQLDRRLAAAARAARIPVGVGDDHSVIVPVVDLVVVGVLPVARAVALPHHVARSAAPVRALPHPRADVPLQVCRSEHIVLISERSHHQPPPPLTSSEN